MLDSTFHIIYDIFRFFIKKILYGLSVPFMGKRVPAKTAKPMRPFFATSPEGEAIHTSPSAGCELSRRMGTTGG